MQFYLALPCISPAPSQLVIFARKKLSGIKRNLWDDLRAGFDFVRLSPLMRLTAYASVLFSVLFFAVAFPFNKVVTASFSDEAGVAGFFGLFNSITTAATFLVSLFLASRIYARLGIINGVFLMPLTYIFSFAVFAGFYSLKGASIAHFAQLVILSGIAGTAWNALFNVVPSQKRGQVLAFNNGVPSQIGVVLSGILLIVAEKAFTVQQIFLMGTVLALVCGGLIWRMRKAYAQALVDALQAGRIEVFSARDAAFSGLQNDAAVLDVAIRALHDEKPAARRLAADMLGRMESDSAIPHLTRLLSDPEPGVRASAVSSLGALYADSTIKEIILLLDDPDDQVREEALTVLPKLKVILSPELVTKISDLVMNDPSLAVQTQATIALTKLGAVDEALSYLTPQLNAEYSSTRIAALETIGEIAPYLNSSFDLKLIMNSIEDPAATIRRAAVSALGSLKDDWIGKTLVKYLTDPDAGVRKAAAESLRRRNHESRALVLEIFKTDQRGCRFCSGRARAGKSRIARATSRICRARNYSCPDFAEPVCQPSIVRKSDGFPAEIPGCTSRSLRRAADQDRWPVWRYVHDGTGPQKHERDKYRKPCCGSRSARHNWR